MFSWLFLVKKLFYIIVCCDGIFCVCVQTLMSFIIYLIYIFIYFQVCFFKQPYEITLYVCVHACVCACACV